MLTTLLNRILYTAGGASPNFAVPYAFYSQLHLEVYQNGVLKTLGTHYTVVPEFALPTSPIGGTITFIVTPPANDVILILRRVPLSQLVDLKDLSIFPADIIEQSFDFEVMRHQQTEETFTRALTIPIINTTTGTELPDPAFAVNRGKFLRNKADGTGFEFIEVTSQAFMNPITTKGDLVVFSSATDRLPVGANDQILVADSAIAQGITWKNLNSLPTFITLQAQADFAMALSMF